MEEFGGGYPICCPQPIVILGLDPRIGVALDRRRAARTDPRVKPEGDEDSVSSLTKLGRWIGCEAAEMEGLLRVCVR